MGELSKPPNIGAVLEEQPHQVGTDTPEQLQAAGSRGAWLSILTINPSACYNRLFALEGALQGIRWRALPAETNQALKAFCSEHK